MYNDKPITEVKEDELKRDRFIRATVAQVKAMNDGSSFIVGLYASWGSGKTSILRLLEKQLRGEGYFTAYFNPWFFQNENGLLIELFKTILKGARSDKKLKPRLNQFGASLKKYADYIRLPKVEFYGVGIDTTDMIQASAKALGTFLDEEPTLFEQKNKVNQQLRTLQKPLIIFLDDIDRLDKEEIRLLFKTVRLTADFDNIIYVLAFDEEIVSKSLNNYYGAGQEDDGRKFIQKIIQLPIRVPELSVDVKFEYTRKLLETWEQSSEQALPSRYLEGFYEQLRNVHRLFLETPRDSKRLINAFSFVEVSLRGEVNAADLVLLESLRLFTPKLFQYLVSNKELLFENPTLQKEENLSAVLDPKEVPHHKKDGTMALLNWLFPENNISMGEGPVSIHDLPLDYFDGHESINERKQNLSRNQCIGSRPYFLKYMEFNIGPDQIPDELFKEVLLAFNKEDYGKLTREIYRLEEFSAPIIYKKFDIHEQELTSTGKSNLLRLLFLNDKFSPSFTYTSTMTGSLQHVNNIIKKSIRFFDQIDKLAEVEDTLRFIIRNSPYYQAVAHLLYHLEHTYNYQENTGGQELNFLKKLDLYAMKQLFTDRMLALETNVYFYDPVNLKNWDMFSLISEVKGKAPLKDKVHAWIALDPGNALALIKSFTSMGLSAGTFYYSLCNFKSTIEQVEKYVDRETLKAAAESFCTNRQGSAPEVEALSEMELVDIGDANYALSYEYLKYVLLDEQKAE